MTTPNRTNGRENADRALRLIEYAREQVAPAKKPGPGDAVPFLSKDAIPGYELGELIGPGGQGVVYRAVQKSTGKSAAVKFIPLPLSGCLDGSRFRREVRALARIDNANIVSIRDSGVVGAFCYVVMDYVAGESLSTNVDGKLPVREAMRLMQRIAQAVHAVHLRAIIHRDLKPSNILVTPEGEPRILDFGLARIIADDDGSPLKTSAVTISGQFVGSLPWASPEQVSGDGQVVDMRTDVYSLGVMLFQMLTGRFPYPVDGSMNLTVRNIEEVAPARPSALRDKVDDDVDTIVLKCLQKEPERRYQSAGDLADDIERYLKGEPIAAKRDSTWYVMRKRLRRYRVAVVASLILAGFGIASSLVLSTLYGQKVRAERDALARTREVGAMDAFLGAMLSSVKSRSDAENLKFVELLRQSDDYIAKSLKDEPLVEASLRVKLGDAYGRMWMNDEAAHHLERALAIRRQHLGDANAQTLDAMGRLALKYNANERPDLAELLFRDLLKVHLASLSPDHPDVVWARMYLADVLEESHKFGEADELYRAALDSFTRQPGEGYSNYANAANNYLVFLTDTNQTAKAESLVRNAVALLEQNAGTDDGKTMHMRSNWARVLTRLGRLEEAADIYRVLVEYQRPRLVDLGAFGGMAMYLGNLAEILRVQNKLDEAEAKLRETVEIVERNWGKEQKTALLARTNLAAVLGKAGRLDEAEQVIRDVLDVSTRWLGDASAESYQAQAVLGELLVASNRLAEAEPLLVTASEGLESTGGLEDTATLEAMQSLGRVRQARGDYEAAEAVFRRVVVLPETVLPVVHWLRGEFRADLGWCLLEQDHNDEAEGELIAGYNTVVQALGAEHPESRRAATHLATLYDALGRPDDAKQYRSLPRD